MEVLISPMTLQEAASIVDTPVDILDVKNVAEGSLGAQAPWITRQIISLAAERGKRSSVAIGDLPDRPGTAGLAACAAASLGADFVKAGLHGLKTRAAARELLRVVVRAAAMGGSQASVVACGYADFESFGGLSPGDLVAAAAEAQCPWVMLDTLNKQKSLLDHLDEASLTAFLRAAKAARLRTALAGSLGLQHLDVLRRLAPELIGVRGAVCSSDRGSAICPDKTRAFLTRVRG